MGITIHTGPVDASFYAEEVPKDKWPDLTRARSIFLDSNLPYDCRELIRYVDEAKAFDIWQECGYGSLDDYIRIGLGIEPEQVNWAIEGLRHLKPEEPVPFEQAIELGQRQIGVEGGIPGPGRGHKTPDNVSRLEYGNTQTYAHARLKRDRTDLYEQVLSGSKSAHKAMVEAGFRKTYTPLETMQRIWLKLSQTERDSFLAWLNTTIGL